MCYGLHFHSSVEGPLGCLQVLSIKNKAAINVCLQVFVWCKFSAHSGKNQEAQLLDHMVRIWSVFQETIKFSSKLATPFCIPTEVGMRVPRRHIFASIPCCHWILAILTGVQWKLIIPEEMVFMLFCVCVSRDKIKNLPNSFY